MSESAHIAPAEWEPHAAIWTAWPSHPELWLEDLAPARAAVAGMCRALAGTGERVEILAPARFHAELAALPARPHDVPFGDIWLRDTGPIFVRGAGGSLAAARFGWNGWGGKYWFPDDDGVGDAIAELAGAPLVRHDWVLEGGAIETDGAGTALTTRQCLLNPNRNPAMTEADVEAALRAALGVERVVWLDEGLRNDHTDGHVDNIARFVAPGVVACLEPGDGDPNRDVLRAIVGDLAAAGFEVVCVPSPGAVLDAAGEPMAASFLNFVIGNGAVVVPVYGTRHDEAAVAVIDALFPGRTTAAVDARGLLTGGGAFHCITREQPT